MNKEIILIVSIVIAVILVILLTLLLCKKGYFKVIKPYVEEAIAHFEKYYCEKGAGEKKLKAVLHSIEKECNKRGIPFILIKNLVKKLIERIVNDYNVIKKGG